MTDRYVLLVEDDPNDEALTLRAFKKNNVLNEVVVARDGAEALAHLFSGDDGDAARPALILLDLQLPEVDGLQVLHRIRADPRTRHLPVVILTTSAHQNDIIASYSGGASAYVRKPISFSDFTEMVKAIGVFWLHLSEPVPDFTSPSSSDDAQPATP